MSGRVQIATALSNCMLSSWVNELLCLKKPLSTALMCLHSCPRGT